jgi:hypothetical protein
VERAPKVENIEVRLRVPVLKKAKQISVFSPDGGGVQTLPPITGNGKFGFVVPSLNTYSVVEVQWE